MDAKLCKHCGKLTPSKTRACCDDCLPAGTKAAMNPVSIKKRTTTLNTPEIKAKQSAGIKLSWSMQEVKDSHSRGAELAWQDANKRANMLLYRQSIDGQAELRSLAHIQWSSAEARANASISAAKLLLEGKTGFKGRNKANEYVTVEGRPITFRSSWEKKVAEYLDADNVSWEYELMPLILDGIAYIPDFFIFGNNGELSHIIEVKGWLSEANEKKFIKFWRWLVDQDIPLELWDEYELKERGIL